MTPKGGDKVYLLHILQAIEKCEQYASVGHEVFMESSVHQDAVIRQLQVMGEAVKRLSTEIRHRRPDVPWRLVAGTRDVLVHDYAGIDLQAVWKVTQDELPPLRSAVESLLTE